MITGNQQAEWNGSFNRKEIPIHFEEFVNVNDNLTIYVFAASEEMLSRINHNYRRRKTASTRLQFKRSKMIIKELKDYSIKQGIEDKVFSLLILLNGTPNKTNLQYLKQRKARVIYVKLHL